MATIVTRSGKGSPLTHAEVDANFTNLNTDKLELSGGTMTGNLSFGDNDKAIFGAGSDLQIYHDGNKSVIQDAGTGNLELQASTQITFWNAARDKELASFRDGEYCRLFYNGSQKLATTNTGVDITGTLTSDGLTVDKTDAVTYSSTAVDDTLVITRKNSSGTNNQVVGIEFDVTQASGATTGVAGISAVQPTNASSADLVFQTRNAGTIGERMRIDSGGDISFYEDTGTTAKFFWDASAERLGIGTSSPNKLIHLKANSPVINLHSDNASSAQVSFTNSGGVSEQGFIKYEHDGDFSGNMQFRVAGSEAMRIDSSGNVGIGTSSPQGAAHVKGETAALGVDDYPQITIETAATSGAANTGGGILFLNHDGTGGSFGGSIQSLKENGTSGNSAHYMRFSTRANGGNVTERMRIDSSGNLLVGKTSSALAGAGISLLSTGRGRFTFDNFEVLELNRLTSDGDIIKFFKDGTTVGSIGATSGVLTVGNANTGGIIFGYSGSHTFIEPSNTSGASTDDLATLGSSTKRFRDLYLSGGVYLGGTGSANKLDDYEEGTWTPELTTTSTAPTGISYGNQSGTYTKIGNVVYIRFGIRLTALTTTGSGEFKLTGLPFTTANFGAYQEPNFAVKGGEFTTASTATNGVFGFFVNSTTFIQFRISDNSDTVLPASEMTSSLFMGGEGFYFVP